MSPLRIPTLVSNVRPGKNLWGVMLIYGGIHRRAAILLFSASSSQTARGDYCDVLQPNSIFTSRVGIPPRVCSEGSRKPVEACRRLRSPVAGILITTRPNRNSKVKNLAISAQLTAIFTSGLAVPKPQEILVLPYPAQIVLI